MGIFQNQKFKILRKMEIFRKEISNPTIMEKFHNEYEAKNGEIRLQKLANMHRKWLSGHYLTLPRPCPNHDRSYPWESRSIGS